MHTLRIGIHGEVEVTREVEVGDADALPLFLKLKALLLPDGEAAPKKRRGRRSKAEIEAAAAATEERDSEESAESDESELSDDEPS